MIWFAHRSPYDGPTGKRSRRLDGSSVLEWFQTAWTIAPASADGAADWVARELGGPVQDLKRAFAGARRPLPGRWQELRDRLRGSLDPAEVRVDERSVRVRAGNEFESAYHFLDEEIVRECANRTAYVLHESWELPDGDGPGGFEPDIMVHPLSAVAGRSGTTYVVLLTYYSTQNLRELDPPWAFVGVRLPHLAEHLRATEPAWSLERDHDDEWFDTPWPGELLFLRALVAPDDEHIGAALGRCNFWPDFELAHPSPQGFGLGAYDVVHPRAKKYLSMPLVSSGFGGRDPSKTLIRCTDHMAQMSIHLDAEDGYQQWFLFDDVWASAHPDLAQSLLRSTRWDPLE